MISNLDDIGQFIPLLIVIKLDSLHAESEHVHTKEREVFIRVFFNIVDKVFDALMGKIRRQNDVNNSDVLSELETLNLLINIHDGHSFWLHAENQNLLRI